MNSRPALRAASGRPPARQRHDGHRAAGLARSRGWTTASRPEQPCTRPAASLAGYVAARRTTRNARDLRPCPLTRLTNKVVLEGLLSKEGQG